MDGFDSRIWFPYPCLLTPQYILSKKNSNRNHNRKWICVLLACFRRYRAKLPAPREDVVPYSIYISLFGSQAPCFQVSFMAAIILTAAVLHLYVRTYIYTNVYIYIYIHICVCATDIRLPLCLSIYLSIYLSIHLPIYRYLYLSVYLSIYMDALISWHFEAFQSHHLPARSFSATNHNEPPVAERLESESFGIRIILNQNGWAKNR